MAQTVSLIGELLHCLDVESCTKGMDKRKDYPHVSQGCRLHPDILKVV